MRISPNARVTPNSDASFKSNTKMNLNPNSDFMIQKMRGSCQKLDATLAPLIKREPE